MKILFNSWAGAFFQKGGGEVQLLKSKQALEDKGHEVHLFNQWSPQENIEIVHQFSIENGVEHVMRKYKELGKPVALSTILWGMPQRGDNEFYRLQTIFNLADILMTNSDKESIRISETFSIDISKFKKTRNSISKDYLTMGEPSAFRKKFDIEGDFILSVANIDKRKNTQFLVEACKELGVKLVTIGHVKDQAYYDSFKNIYAGYKHLGPIEDTEMLKSAYSACDVFALPSYCETPGIAALEAASQGAKIVITSEGSTEEYFGDKVLYVEPSNFDSIKSGIQTALKIQSTHYLADFIKNNYTWDKTAEEILSGYQKLINHKRKIS